MVILDGKRAREHYFPILKNRVKELGYIPKLAIVQVGEREDSNAYIKAKKSFAEKIGVEVLHNKFDENTKQEEVIDLIKKLNNDNDVSGIIVQLPLPSNFDSLKIINSISIKKDADGLVENSKVIPATARGIKELLRFYKIRLAGKRVTVVGRSKIVGLPTAKMFEKEGSIVTVCHSKTEDIEEKTKDADILVVAIGRPNLIDEYFVSKDQIVVDVGITREGKNLIGDVDFDNVKDIVGMITPVPGGVGQMTVLALFENVVDLCYNSRTQSRV
jgi:methylenetetrahydrofolate dehydrogenase (NADP+)/methenyltetrahydrofolate cyclohydrolase